LHASKTIFYASKLIRNLIFIAYLKNIEPFDFITILSLAEEESCKLGSFLNVVKGALAEWSRHPGSTFQVPGSTSSGSKFLSWVKKIPSPHHTSKHRLRFCPATTMGHWPGTHIGLCDSCVMVGEGFGRGGYLREKVFLY
jgi:hypothetical protein